MTSNDFNMIRTNIALLYKQKEDYMKRLDDLSEYKGVNLKRSSPDRGKHFYYYTKKPNSSSYLYLGSDASQDVKNVKEVHYLNECICRIDYNIRLLKKTISEYLPINYNSVASALPITYRGAVLSDNEERSEKIRLWKEEMLSIKASYPIKHQEQLTHTYVDGTMMRSKSELTVALSLDFYKIPYVYEVPIKIDGYVIYPDFRLLSPVDLKESFILEQFGRMDLDNYQESVGWKISKYMMKGFMPNINFFMNFDDLEGNADLRPLHEFILKISGHSETEMLIA